MPSLEYAKNILNFSAQVTQLYQQTYSFQNFLILLLMWEKNDTTSLQFLSYDSSFLNLGKYDFE